MPDSDLPLRVAFPLFIQNTLQWLTGRAEPAAEEADAGIRAGESLAIAPGETLWTHAQRTYAPLPGTIPAAERLTGPAQFQPETNGFYLIRAADGADRWVAVNTFDPDQSALNDPGAPAAAAPVAASRPLLAGALDGWWATAGVWPPWMYLAGAAFVLFSLEWLGFHRRRTE